MRIKEYKWEMIAIIFLLVSIFICCVNMSLTQKDFYTNITDNLTF